MSTITAILDPDPDGSLHLPLPVDLRHGRVKVVATLELVTPVLKSPKPGIWKEFPGEFWMSPDFDEPLEDFREYMG